jgi:hypothetical protein
MRSKYFLGLLVTGAALGALVGGCGGDVDGTGGSGGEGGTPATSSSKASTGTTNPGTGGTGGVGECPGDMDGNCDFDTAETIDTMDEIEADLEPVDADEDFYVLDGKEGQALLIYTAAKPPTDPFSKEFADLVITVYDEDMKQLAENDDPTPRISNDSEIYTILPKAGKYFIRVEECNTWAKQNGLPDTSCSAAGDISETKYTIGILELDPALSSIVIEDKAMDIADPAAALAMEYQPGMMAGTYLFATNGGWFTDAADKDYYSFTLPGNYMIAADERLIGYFNVLPGGTAGNGSTAPTGIVTIIDQTTMEVVAQIDGSSSDDLSPPLVSGMPYLLEVDAKAGGDFMTNPFYFVIHYGGGSNPVEEEITMMIPNDVALNAQPLMKAMTQDSFFIEGNVVVALADVDYFKMTVPPGNTLASVACGAQRSGSGLRQLKASLLKDDMMQTQLKTGTEAADKDLLLQDVAVTAGDSLLLKVEAAAQDMTVTSSFYRCGIHFSTP